MKWNQNSLCNEMDGLQVSRLSISSYETPLQYSHLENPVDGGA